MTAQALFSWLGKHWAKLASSLLVLFAFLGLLRAAELPLWPGMEALQRVPWGALLLYFGLWSGVHLVRALRWQLLLAPIGRVPTRRILSASFIGFAAIVLLPLRMGEFVRPALVRRGATPDHPGVISGWAALGTIGAERIIDGLLLTLMLTLSMALTPVLSPLPDQIGHLAISVAVVPLATRICLIGFAAALLAMFLFYFARHFSERVLHLTLGRWLPNVATALGERLIKLASGLQFLTDWKLCTAFTLVSLGYWLLNAYANLLLGHACGLHAMGFGEASVVTGVLALGILVPNAPGFFGAFQFAIYAALAMYFPHTAVLGQGTLYVFFMYLLQMLVTLGAALLGLLIGQGSPKLGPPRTPLP